MSFECNDCHTIATGQPGAYVHFHPISRGPCETCGITKECFECQCLGDWAKARHTAHPPAEGRTPNDAPTRHAMWQSLASNELGEQIAKIMAEGRYDETYDNGPEFHYGIVAALRSRTADEALRALLDVFAQLQGTSGRMMARFTELAKIAPMEAFFIPEGDAAVAAIKNVDKPGTG